jgi:hypothetical protein
LTQLREQYVNTGKVRFVYKHFAILGPESNRAAEASECAADQGKFWEYHDRVFADQLSTRSTLSADQLTNLATEIGLDPNAFRDCLKSGIYTTKVRQESLSIQSMGVRGTPAFLLNGTFISGAQPFEVFQQVIEEQLSSTQAPTPQPPATEEPVSQASPPQEPTRPDDDIEGVIFFAEQSRDHQDGKIEYEHDMPPGGAHSDAWQNCGIYDEPLVQELVMHSLEHGAVWVAYRPDLPVEQVEMLRNVIRDELQAGVEPLVLLSPQPELAASLVATAWQVQLHLDSPADERLLLFLKKYQNGPYTPEPGAPCTGGVGEPLE